MIREVQQITYSLLLISITFVTSLFLLTSCLNLDDDFAKPQLSLGQDVIAIKYASIKDIRSMYSNNGQDKWAITDSLYIKAVVISDRVSGNRPSQRDGFIQDEAGDGLAFRVSQSIHSYNLGDELIIYLKGATLLYYDGILQLNFSNKTSVLKAQDVTVAPKELTIEEILNGPFDGTLVKIRDVQFKDYKGLNYYEKGLASYRTLETCNNSTFIVKTTKYATFKDETLPAGKGNVIGIVSQNDGKWEFLIRNLNDVKEMSNDKSTRCPIEVSPVVKTRISISDFRLGLVENEAYIEENYIEGEVILNPYNRNVPDSIVYLADESAGIALSFFDKENILINVPIGSKVKIHLKDTNTKVINGLLQVGYSNSLSTKNVEIIEKSSTKPLQPKVARLEEILEGKYQSELVKIDNVQFKETDVKYINSPIITNESNQEIGIYTRESATFANETVKKGMGSIVSVVSIQNSPHLLFRSVDDLADMTGNRFSDFHPYINIDKNSLIFEVEGGQETINILSNVNWSVNSDNYWLKISAATGINNGVITAIASKNEGAERKALITINDGTITKYILITQRAKKIIVNTANDLFFSEYIEGSSNNKYLEIYNGTGSTVDLSDYKIELYVNGNNTAKTIETLKGILDNGKVIVFKHAKAAIYDGETTVSTAINYNGNDAIALVKISTDSFVDIIGCIGFDPGKEWIDDSYPHSLTTKDKTLVRKPSVRKGLTKNPAASFPTLRTEWISYPVDTIDYLGWHTMD